MDESLRGDIENAITEVKDAPERERDEAGKFAAKEKAEDVATLDTAAVTEEAIVAPTEATVVEKKEPPKYISAAARAKWDGLDPELQAEFLRREEETHKKITTLDEERNFGKSLKDVITPYLPIINAEGGSPASAVKDLLNTAYVLRTGAPAQKAALMQQVIQQYGIDMSLLAETQNSYVDPSIQQLQAEVQQLRQQSNPENMQKMLQDRMETDRINAEVRAFASDPVNGHYEQVKAVMASLLVNGVAKDMKEAYEAACYADPKIRPVLEAKKQADEQAKRNAEIAAKKRAAVSVTGSPGAIVANSGSPERSLRDEIAANLRAATSS